MDEGTLSDAKGRKVDFRNTILILTSNLGTDIIRRQSAIGFSSKNDEAKYLKLKENVIESVEKSFKPEFVNRLDKIIVFYQLNQKNIRRIVDLQIDELSQRISKLGFKLIADTKIRDYIAEKSFSTEFGARPIKKFIADQIETEISEAILAERYQAQDHIVLNLEKNKIRLDK